jgi:hypothetical protein
MGFIAASKVLTLEVLLYTIYRILVLTLLTAVSAIMVSTFQYFFKMCTDGIYGQNVVGGSEYSFHFVIVLSCDSKLFIHFH